MINLQTQVPNPITEIRLKHSKPIILIGSCFTENIGNRLRNCGFEVLINPFGILYNPDSIAQCLEYCLFNKNLSEKFLIEHNGLTHSWLHHSSFSRPTKEECLQTCQESITEAYNKLQDKATIIVTLGSAWVYERCDVGIVANCHKIPNKEFTKRRLTIEEIVQRWQPLVNQIKEQSQEIIFTVSPIRHWADTPHGNQLSKSSLLLAIEVLSQENTCYFPTYEIMMDELRDYRFYDQDMLHPSPLAIDIIWERFAQTFFDKKERIICEKYLQLNQMQQHRPKFPESEEWKIFQQKMSTLSDEISTLRAELDY